MLILGIESSCDETAAAVVDCTDSSYKILSNVVASQVSVHAAFGGVVPEVASRAHAEAISGVVYKALDDARITVDSLSAVGVTCRPGLIGALLVGVNFAKGLAISNNIPLVGVNHIYAHIASAKFGGDIKPPYLALTISGGNTAIYDINEKGEIKMLGSTLDDAAGEAFDKIGRVIGLTYPAGAAMDALAAKGKPTIKLPSPALTNYDFSFSGLKTAALNYINNTKAKGDEINKEDLAASVTDAIVTAICKKTESAMQRLGRTTIALTGGVSANSHLRAVISAICNKYGAKLVLPPLSLCGDNGAMIAAEAYRLLCRGVANGEELTAIDN